MDFDLADLILELSYYGYGMDKMKGKSVGNIWMRIKERQNRPISELATFNGPYSALERLDFIFSNTIWSLLSNFGIAFITLAHSLSYLYIYHPFLHKIWGRL